MNGRRSHPAGDGGVRRVGEGAEAGRACVGVHSKATVPPARIYAGKLVGCIEDGRNPWRNQHDRGARVSKLVRGTHNL